MENQKKLTATAIDIYLRENPEEANTIVSAFLQTEAGRDLLEPILTREGDRRVNQAMSKKADKLAEELKVLETRAAEIEAGRNSKLEELQLRFDVYREAHKRGLDPDLVTELPFTDFDTAKSAMDVLEATDRKAFERGLGRRPAPHDNEHPAAIDVTRMSVEEAMEAERRGDLDTLLKH